MGRKFFDTLTPAELEKLKQSQVERSQKTYQRNNLIFDFLFYSGLRVSELVNIRHSDWEGKSLRVHGKGNKIRTVFLPPFLAAELNPNYSVYLFTNHKQKPLSPLVIRQIIQQRVKKSGIEKKITPHSFRRSFATHLHNQKAQLTTIQMLLGHESITTTERYIRPDFDYLYEDYSKIWKNTEISA
jgi:integrase/recombinase XerD